MGRGGDPSVSRSPLPRSRRLCSDGFLLAGGHGSDQLLLTRGHGNDGLSSELGAAGVTSSSSLGVWE